MQMSHISLMRAWQSFFILRNLFSAPTLPVLRYGEHSAGDFTLSIAFSAGKVDRVELTVNEALESPPTSDEGTFQVLDPTTNLEFDFTTADPSVVAPVLNFSFTNLRIDTRYWFTVRVLSWYVTSENYIEAIPKKKSESKFCRWFMPYGS